MVNIKKKKIRLLIAVISTILLIGVSGIYITMLQMDDQTSKTTVQYSATVDRVKVQQSNSKPYIEIYVKEYSNSLYISQNISQSINLNDISDLQCGDTVFFRIQSEYADQMNQAFFVPIVSLETETISLLSLEQYNHITGKTLLPSKIVCVTIAILLLIVATINFCSLRKR